MSEGILFIINFLNQELLIFGYCVCNHVMWHKNQEIMWFKKGKK